MTWGWAGEGAGRASVDVMDNSSFLEFLGPGEVSCARQLEKFSVSGSEASCTQRSWGTCFRPSFWALTACRVRDLKQHVDMWDIFQLFSRP